MSIKGFSVGGNVERYDYNSLDNLPSEITIDTALSGSSTNPVQNKTVTGAINALSGEVSDLKSATNDPTNLFVSNNVTSGRLLSATDSSTAGNVNCYYSDYIPVIPGARVYVSQSINSNLYGHQFYTADREWISSVPSNDASLTAGYDVPSNASFIRVSGLISLMPTMTVTQKIPNSNIVKEIYTEIPSDVNTANPYARKTIKAVEKTTEGYTHQAFPSTAFFDGNIVIASRVSMSHLTPSDPAQYGGISIDTIAPDGTITHRKIIKATQFTGASGELRDPQIAVTKDGNQLVLATWTTYEGSKHDNILALIDKKFDVVDYNVEANVNFIYWGNPVFTPTGHLLISCYYNGAVAYYRSDEAFSDSVSALTMTRQSNLAWTNNPTEGCLGYWNDYLVMLVRCNNGNSIAMATADKEATGYSGWSVGVSIGIALHSPKILPYYSGKYLVFAGALLDHNNSWTDSLRYAVLGYVDLSLNTSGSGKPVLTASVVSYGNVDESQKLYGGYLGFVPFGGEEYGIAYYQEGGTSDKEIGASTGLYFKRINARYLNPAITWLI